MGPEPPFVGDAEPLPGVGGRLAGEAGSDEIHSAAPRVAVEGREVVPDRSRIQGLVFHPRHEGGRCEGFPLDVTHSAVGVSEGEPESELEPAGAGT
jgi:hypothetical protein